MNKFLIIIFCSLLFLRTVAQQSPLLQSTNRWILVNNKIEKNEIFLSSYKKTKLKSNTLVLSFAENGKIVYDYETSLKHTENTTSKYLDINTKESTWVYDTLKKTLLLSIQAGYFTLDDFRFQREYSIDQVPNGYILMKTKDICYENLKKTHLVADQVQEKPPLKVSTAQMPKAAQKSTIKELTTPPAKVNYLSLHKDLFDKNKRWILVRNKIERGDIYLTPYDQSKLTINNLVLYLSDKGKIEYDYKSDPTIEICAGVDFLDIDTDESSWVFDAENNIFTLILKGGYASLDDFKFKRDYSIEAFDDGFALRKLKEYYFDDLLKPKKTTRNYGKR